MIRALGACLALVSLAGCSNTEAVSAAKDMADAVCACKKLTCAQEKYEEHSKRIQDFTNARGTTDDLELIRAAGARANDCVTRLRKSGD